MKNKPILYAIILGFFILYWGITIFFNLPDNYLKIKSAKGNAYFQFFLFQRWGFFAPPPTFNDRLYFIYKSKGNSKSKIIEVLEDLYKQKSSRAPFNSKENIMDYLLSNSINSLCDDIVELENYKRYAVLTKQLKKDTTIISLIQERMEGSPQFNTLVNYGLTIAKHDKELSVKDSISFIITRIYIPVFVDRFMDSIRKEEFVFQSKFKPIQAVLDK
jgi:hypothetical protein